MSLAFESWDWAGRGGNISGPGEFMFDVCWSQKHLFSYSYFWLLTPILSLPFKPQKRKQYKWAIIVLMIAVFYSSYQANVKKVQVHHSINLSRHIGQGRIEAVRRILQWHAGFVVWGAKINQIEKLVYCDLYWCWVWWNLELNVADLLQGGLVLCLGAKYPT